MTDRPFSVTAPADPSAGVPMLVHLPHAGTKIPDAVRARIRISDEQLADEVLAMTDWHTGDLFGPAATDAGATVITNHLSRLVVDPERLPNHREPAAAYGMGAVYTHTRHGTPMRSKAETPDLLDQYFQPWADTVSACVTAHLEQFGHCLILDGHSFPAEPFPFEDPSQPRPDIDLGWSDPHRPEGLVDQVAELAANRGYSVAENTPFSGAYVPLGRYGRDAQVTALMVEVNRRVYLNETTGAKASGWDEAAALISEIVTAAADWARSRETNA